MKMVQQGVLLKSKGGWKKLEKNVTMGTFITHLRLSSRVFTSHSMVTVAGKGAQIKA